MKAPGTLRARLTLWYVGAVAVTLSAFAVFLYVWLDRVLYRHHDRELLDDANGVASVLQHVPLDQHAIENALASLDSPPRLLMVRDHFGELVYRSPLLEMFEPTIGQHQALIHAAASASRAPEFFSVTLTRLGLVRFVCAPIGGVRAAYVQVGSELGDVPATLRAVAVASIALVPAVLVLTTFGGWIIARRALAPVESMTSTLEAIEATDLSRRVEVNPGDRELGGLVKTINNLLGRLDRAFQDLRDFTADVSHQLRTPLAVMKNTTEHAREADMDSPHLDELDREIDGMSMVINDLQALSLADADTQRMQRRELDLSELCGEVTDVLAALAEPKDVRVAAAIEPGITVVGDAIKIKQMILNLGDNAIKYTAEGGEVHVSLTLADGFAVIEVADTGVGIDPDQVPRVFDRFYRADAEPGSRGYGLGLAIAKRIAEVHQGSIEASSTVGRGTRMTVRLPGAARSSQHDGSTLSQTA